MKTSTLILFLMITLNGFAQNHTGFTDIDSIENNNEYSWFGTNYRSYEPDKLVIDSMMSLPSEYKLLVFGGVWCDDTQNLLPKLYKCSDHVNISRSDISLYLLDEEKQSSQGLEKTYKITNVPTFIVLKNGVEAGRITESVQSTLENDLLQIMK